MPATLTYWNLSLNRIILFGYCMYTFQVTFSQLLRNRLVSFPRHWRVSWNVSLLFWPQIFIHLARELTCQAMISKNCDVASPISVTVVPHNSDGPLREARESAFFARPTGTYTLIREKRPKQWAEFPSGRWQMIFQRCEEIQTGRQSICIMQFSYRKDLPSLFKLVAPTVKYYTYTENKNGPSLPY